MVIKCVELSYIASRREQIYEMRIPHFATRHTVTPVLFFLRRNITFGLLNHKYLFSRSLTHYTKLMFVLQAACCGSIQSHHQVSSKCLISGFAGLEVACWPLVPKLAGSNPAE
jgi:hypothetical protein